MFADELTQIDRAYALDSAFAKEIHRTAAEGRKGSRTEAEAMLRDPNQRLKEEYSRER